MHILRSGCYGSLREDSVYVGPRVPLIVSRQKRIGLTCGGSIDTFRIEISLAGEVCPHTPHQTSEILLN